MSNNIEDFIRKQSIINAKQKKINAEQEVLNDKIGESMIKIIKQFLNIYSCLLAMVSEDDRIDDDGRDMLNKCFSDLKNLEKEVNEET